MRGKAIFLCAKASPIKMDARLKGRVTAGTYSDIRSFFDTAIDFLIKKESRRARWGLKNAFCVEKWIWLGVVVWRRMFVPQEMKVHLMFIQPMAVVHRLLLRRSTSHANLMFKRKAKTSCNGERSVTKNLRARQDCTRTCRKTDFRQKNETSAGLKITFVDMTCPGQRRGYVMSCPLIFSCPQLF